jgi:16S rRNA (cytosine1402-N4)-methyltransferase
MSQEDQAAAFVHRPVMVDEVVGLLGPVPDGPAVDATVGGGGHARAILRAHPQLRIIGLDRDADALAAAERTLAEFGERAVLRRARFDQLDAVLDGLGVSAISAALFDLGVSSPQLDRVERGFSYRGDAPLDMRMDRDDARTAADIVNNEPLHRLAELFAANGEGRFAGRIAKAIVAARPVTTTAQLVDVVRDAIPSAARRTGGHPAKRVFQALRIEVNRELDVLPIAIDAAIARLAPGGRLVVISYHSGEDRIVKDRLLAAESGGCTCLPGLPCRCGAVRTVRLIHRGARKPGPAEVSANPRAESARLRSAEKLATTPSDVA